MLGCSLIDKPHIELDDIDRKDGQQRYRDKFDIMHRASLRDAILLVLGLSIGG